MRRRTCLVSGALLACGMGGAARAVPGFEGIGTWLATVGPADNRARIGLELAHDAAGALRARYTIDLLNFYAAALPPLELGADGRWGIAAYDFWVRHAGDSLQVSGLIDEMLEMRRGATLPEPPARPVPPRGADPLWSVRLGGAIFASAAAHGDRVYLGNTDGVMFAVDTRDGTVAWSYAAGRAIHGEATVTDDAVYFGCDNGWLFRLDRASGKEVWRYDLGDGRVARILPNPYVFDYDHAAPRPVLRDGVLYLGAGDGGFHAVDATGGTRIWRHAAQGKVRASAAVDDAWVVFGTLAGTIHGLDRASGAERWRWKTGGPVTGAPVFAGAQVIVGDRGSRLNAIVPGRDQPLWSQPWYGSWIESTAVVREREAYIGSGDLFLVSAFDVASGRNRWRSHVGGWVLQRPAVTERRVYASVSGARRRALHFLPQAAGLVAIERSDGGSPGSGPPPRCPAPSSMASWPRPPWSAAASSSAAWTADCTPSPSRAGRDRGPRRRGATGRLVSSSAARPGRTCARSRGRRTRRA